MYEIDNQIIDFAFPPPEDEPARQQFFIARCRAYFAEKKRLPSGKRKACVVTFGCQMNARDSEKLTGILEEIGFAITDEEEKADFVLFNTCTVRDNANQRVYGRLGRLNNLKKKNPEMIVAVCGCMMQEQSAVDKIKKSYRFVDLIFGTHNLYKLAELLWNRLENGGMVDEIWKEARTIVEELPVERKYPFKSGVNIMFGCDNYCSYCIVPHVRGRERSRNPEDILKEIRKLAGDGVVEIMLLGQNVNSYGKNLDPPTSFAELLRQAAMVDGIERIRFMTSHPKDLSEELIQVMRETPKICRHLHLPLQSGSTEVLKRMNRKYTKEQYLSLVRKIRVAIPDISLTTDIIVGFPGETENDFEETLDVVRQVGFDSAFTFIYSPRTGTPAASMEQLEEGVVKARFERLLKEVQSIASKVSGRDVHTVQKVLAEEEDRHTAGLLTGRLSNNTVVHFNGDASLIGKIVDVYLEESKGFYYFGYLTDDSGGSSDDKKL